MNKKNYVKKEKWSLKSPKKGKERHTLLKVCGPHCFLLPNVEKFPVCAALNKTTHSCHIDQDGVLAAYKRARQYKYKDVEIQALKLRKNNIKTINYISK